MGGNRFTPLLTGRSFVFRKIALFLATVLIIGVAFIIYQWREDSPLLVRNAADNRTSTPLRERVSTRPVDETQLFEFRDVKVPPGESPRVRVFDRKGNAKIVFQAVRWNAIKGRETAFNLESPSARLLLPGGQLAYVWADAGEVELQKGDGNNFNPRKGWLKGNVRIFVDRSKPDWREANPDRIEPEQHPEMIVKMWLEDVDFDLDLGRLESKGAILVQAPDGTMTGRGLELVWNESTRQIKLLRILQGDRAWMRTSGLVDFGVGGSVKEVETGDVAGPVGDSPKTAGPKNVKQGPAKSAQAAAPAAQPERPAARKSTREQLQFEGTEDQEQALRRPKDERIDSYKVTFGGQVLAEQKDGSKTVGYIRSSLLQLVLDVGREERERVQHAPGTQPADGAAPKPVAPTTSPAGLANATPESTSRIEIRWTGELVAVPDQTRLPEPAPESDKPANSRAERFHLIATGSPVDIFSRDSGAGTCQQLEYHAETRRVWLTGTRETLAQVVAGEGRELAGEKIYFDRQLGIARIEGPGRMVDVRSRKEKDVPPCMAELAREADREDPGLQQSEISWTRWAQVEFGIAQGEPAAQLASATPGKPARKASAVYLQHAAFEGDAQVKRGGDLFKGDRMEAIFVKPASSNEVTADKMVAMDRLILTGHVRMLRTGDPAAVADAGARKPRRSTEADDMVCDRLEVQMTVDDTGRNVPRVAHAFGKVYARRTAGSMYREIRANDGLEITLESRPRPVTPEEQARLELVARRCNYTEDSREWKAMQRRLEQRRRLVTTQMLARGDVSVVMHDPSDSQRNVDISAESLDCSLRDDEEITNALVVGTADRPAVVDLGEFYAKGPQIRLDVDSQSMDIPGAGRLRFLSKQDLAGRATDRPVPVVVDWNGQMVMRGQQNLSTFNGGVVAVSGGTKLESRELRIEFVASDAPLEESRPPLTQRWILRPMFGRSQKQRTAQESPSSKLATQMRKKASYIRAVGDAVITSTEYAEPPKPAGPFRTLVSKLLPIGGSNEPPPPLGQIVSRFRVAGPQIGIDLQQENFGVEGPGNLLIEDWRLPSDKPVVAPISPAASAAVGGIDAGGPSQTVFQWESSMTFLNKRNLAQFDRRVDMRHLSGRNMVYAREVINSLNADPRRLRNIKSRQINLTCGNLLVQFADRGAREKKSGASPLSNVTQLARFDAREQVLLDVDDGKETLTGSLLKYQRDSDDVRFLYVYGAAEAPATYSRSADRFFFRATQGDPIIWDIAKGRFSFKGGEIRSTR